jgi:Lrp/AsnC family transcriptional regulator
MPPINPIIIILEDALCDAISDLQRQGSGDAAHLDCKGDAVSRDRRHVDSAFIADREIEFQDYACPLDSRCRMAQSVHAAHRPDRVGAGRDYEQERELDQIDRKIIDILQQDATVPIATIADRVGLSPGPCWRRIKKLEKDGVLARRVALVDRHKANLPMTVFVTVKAPRHAAEWLAAFRKLIAGVPEIVEAWRLTGEADYLLRIVVPDVATYDMVYQRLIARLEFSDVNSSIAMEEMKFTTALPTNYLLP